MQFPGKSPGFRGGRTTGRKKKKASGALESGKGFVKRRKPHEAAKSEGGKGGSSARAFRGKTPQVGGQWGGEKGEAKKEAHPLNLTCWVGQRGGTNV